MKRCGKDNQKVLIVFFILVSSTGFALRKLLTERNFIPFRVRAPQKVIGRCESRKVICNWPVNKPCLPGRLREVRGEKERERADSRAQRLAGDDVDEEIEFEFQRSRSQIISNHVLHLLLFFKVHSNRRMLEGSGGGGSRCRLSETGVELPSVDNPALQLFSTQTQSLQNVINQFQPSILVWLRPEVSSDTHPGSSQKTKKTTSVL